MSDQIKQALCCVCGALRTCRRPRNHRRENYWLHGPVDRDWHRETGELKCAQCNRITVHAIITGDDHVEKLHKEATGWVTKSLTDADRERIRRRWREGQLANPKLHHQWWISAEKKAREAGESHITAFCQAKVELPERKEVDAGGELRGVDSDVLSKPWISERVHTADPATEWFRLACVDCLRLGNRIAINQQRDALKKKLIEIVAGIDKLDERTVISLVSRFGNSESCDS